MEDTTEVGEYRAAVMACVIAAKMLAQHDLPKLLEAIAHADSVGPLLDPTLWMQKSQAMTEDKGMLQAALPLHALGKKLAAMRPEAT